VTRGLSFSANFSIPSAEAGEEGETPIYNEIIFAELNREEAEKLIEEYIKVNVQWPVL
jgi:hypothetical protein